MYFSHFLKKPLITPAISLLVPLILSCTTAGQQFSNEMGRLAAATVVSEGIRGQLNPYDRQENRISEDERGDWKIAGTFRAIIPVYTKNPPKGQLPFFFTCSKYVDMNGNNHMEGDEFFTKAQFHHNDPELWIFYSVIGARDEENIPKAIPESETGKIVKCSLRIFNEQGNLEYSEQNSGQLCSVFGTWFVPKLITPGVYKYSLTVECNDIKRTDIIKYEDLNRTDIITCEILPD